METIYCAACGVQMSSEALACPQCGHPTSNQAPNAVMLNSNPDLIGPLLVTASPSIGFGDAVRSYFKNYATFSGRARRSEFWFAYLFQALVQFPIYLFLLISGDGGSGGLFVLASAMYLVAVLGLFIPLLAVTSRRLHDAGQSFGYYFMVLIPIAGSIIVLLKFAEEGTQGTNRFGPSPKFS